MMLLAELIDHWHMLLWLFVAALAASCGWFLLSLLLRLKTDALDQQLLKRRKRMLLVSGIIMNILSAAAVVMIVVAIFGYALSGVFRQ